MDIGGRASRILHAMAAQNLSWAQAIAELIDNSFDAGATRVDIRLHSNPRAIEIADDGEGVADIERMLRLGDHVDQGGGRVKLGMYGVGLKDAWLWVGKRIEIETVHRGRRGVLDLSTDQISDEWKAHDPTYSDAGKADPGTRLTLFLSKDRRLPNPEAWDRIATVFSPALSEGKQITIRKSGDARRKPLKSVDLPEFVDGVDDEFDVDGRHVSMHIGIVADVASKASGQFWLVYGHRVIAMTALGAGGYSTCGMAGRITLGQGWKLTRNKDDLGSHRDELAAAIFKRIEPLLKKNDQLSEDVELAEIKRKVEHWLDGAISSARKEKRASPSNEVGAVLPASTGRKRRKAKQTQDGEGSIEAQGGKSKNGFILDWFHSTENTIGQFEPLTCRVRLNRLHPFVKAAKESGNAAAIYGVAIAVLTYHVVAEPEGQKLLAYAADAPRFDETFASLMKAIEDSGKTNAKGVAKDAA